MTNSSTKFNDKSPILLFTLIFLIFLGAGIFYFSLEPFSTLNSISLVPTGYPTEVPPTHVVSQSAEENSSLEPKATVTLSPQPTQPPHLPAKYLIKTAFTEQAPEKNWDQPWQDACEEAALLTVDFYYKNQQPDSTQIKQAILDMIDYERQQGFTKDLNIDQMAIISRQYLGYQPQIINNPTINQIRRYITQDIPVIIPANGKKLFAENRHFNDGGPYYHNLVILGYDQKKSRFIVHDVGTRHGAYFKYSYGLLMDSIHDWPDSNQKQDIDSGAKKILILLK